MRIELTHGDITTLEVDAIVNAANSHLQHGGGVAGAIVRRGGSVIQEESNRIGYVPVGNAAVTTAGSLPCKYVIHAVGPRMGEGDEDRKLKDATIAALERAEELRLSSVAFPAISTGIFGFPVDRCARIMTRAAVDFESRAKALERVIFCLFDDDVHAEFEQALRDLQNG
ncbi:MAG TPA: macro domain-containing protein [Thermoanaerobaculia bacterium]